MLNLYHPSTSIRIPWCRLNACKTQYKCVIYTIPRHPSGYPDVASMHVARNKHVEFISSLGIHPDTLMSPLCVQNAIHMLKWYHPSASMRTPWCRLNVCKTQCKCWFYTIPRHPSSYPDVASMHATHNTNVEFTPSFVIHPDTLMPSQCVQPQYKCWIYTIPRRPSGYPDVASMHVKHNTNVSFIPSLGIHPDTLLSPQCV